MDAANSHTPRSRFLRKGEDKNARRQRAAIAAEPCTPFGTKGRSVSERARSATAQRRGDAGVREQKAHLPRSPFLRKGEDKHARRQRKKDIAKILASAMFVFTATSAAAAVGPNIRVVQPDHLNDYWVMTNTSLDVDVPNSGVNLEKPTCSAVTYMIGSDGVTRDIVVVKTIPAGDLETVAKSAVKDMHYAPGVNNALRQPVFTYIIIPFNLPKDPAARKQITEACVLKDFPKGYR